MVKSRHSLASDRQGQLVERGRQAPSHWLSSGIAAVVALALAVLALVMLHTRPAASTTQATVDG